MNAINMILLALALILGFCSGHQLTCEPGETFYDKCNFCRCANDGSGAACTRVACPPGIYDSLEDVDDVYVNNGGDYGRLDYPVAGLNRCQPGTVFKHDCNTCICSDDGFSAACTLQPCISNGYDGLRCQPGQQFRRNCNTCLCGGNGRTAVCTQMDCSGFNPYDEFNDGYIP